MGKICTIDFLMTPTSFKDGFLKEEPEKFYTPFLNKIDIKETETLLQNYVKHKMIIHSWR